METKMEKILRKTMESRKRFIREFLSNKVKESKAKRISLWKSLGKNPTFEDRIRYSAAWELECYWKTERYFFLRNITSKFNDNLL